MRRVAPLLGALLLLSAACGDQPIAAPSPPVDTDSSTPTSQPADTPSPTSSAVPTETPSATPAPEPSAAAGCGDPTAHVYHPYRLHLLAACVTVTGTVAVIRREADGDLHILLSLDPGQERYVNAVNASQQHGDLVLEPVCVGGITQADALSACADYHNPLQIPSVGAHVSVTGAWVLDADHGWLEIHPVASFG